MFNIPKNAIKIHIDGSTVDFFEFVKDELQYYYFDCSLCTPPDPMVNAMLGLELLDKEDKRLIMINHSIPNALFMRVNSNFEYEVEQLEENVKIEFKYKNGTTLKTDFSDNQCKG